MQALVALLNARPDAPRLPSPAPRLERVNHRSSPCTAAEQQQQAPSPQGGRRLAGKGWEARAGTFLPCDPAAYFTGQHAHCGDSLLRFYADDVRFLH